MGMLNMPSAMAAHILMLALLTATSALPMQHGAAQQLAEAEAAIDHMLADDALARRARAEFMHMHEHGGGGGGGGGGAAGFDERVGGPDIDALAGGALVGAEQTLCIC